MKSESKRAIGIFSPLSLALISLFVSLVFWIIPVSTYKHYLGEQSYYSYNLFSLFWILSCTIAFSIGIYLVNKFKISLRGRVSRKPQDFSIIITLVLTILISLVYIVLLSQSLGGIKNFLGSIFKSGSNSGRIEIYLILRSAQLGWVPQLVFPIVAYASYLIFNKRSRYISSLSAILLILYFIMIVPNQTKSSLISFFVILVFTFAYNKFRKNQLSIRKSLIYLSTIFIVGMALFIVMQSTKQGRDFSKSDGIITEIFGYGPASYNRLGALLEGELKLPNSNMGFYTNTWYWGIPGTQALNKNLKRLEFEIPAPSFDNWLLTFKYVENYGLNPQYIWPTVYGEAFIDYGYLAILWFLLYGMVSQICWKLIILRNEKYLLLYSVVLLANLQWYATASIGNKSLIFSIIIVCSFSLLSYLDRQNIPMRVVKLVRNS